MRFAQFLIRITPFAVIVVLLTPVTVFSEAAQPIEPGQIEEAIAHIDKVTASGEFSGVVLVARDGEVLLEKAVGLARREQGVPNTLKTRFNIGSITKVVTRIIITQLRDEGRLTYDDPVSLHIPGYPDPEIAEQVTIQHLLDMSSGLGDIFGDRYDATPKDEIIELSDYLKLFAGKPLIFEPGTEKRYSNAGYIVLGLIIEKLAGTSYAEAAAKRVFKPAGMTGSALLELSDLSDDAAFGYTRDGWTAAMRGGEAPTGAWRLNVDSLPGRGSSAGGSYSTANDLLVFNRALSEGTLCDPSYWRKFGGMGVAGGAPGINAAIESDWEEGWTIVVLTNLDPPAAMQMAGTLRATFGWGRD
jgi:CubicO group peptidase (beta-lactamase class C family)